MLRTLLCKAFHSLVGFCCIFSLSSFCVRLLLSVGSALLSSFLSKPPAPNSNKAEYIFPVQHSHTTHTYKVGHPEHHKAQNTHKQRQHTRTLWSTHKAHQHSHGPSSKVKAQNNCMGLWTSVN